MDSNEDIFKALKKQNEQTKLALGGLSSFQNLAETLRKSQVQFELKGLSQLNHIVQSYAEQMKSIQSIAATMDTFPKIEFPQIKSYYNNYALAGLSKQLSEIAKSNKLFSDQLSNFAISQLVVSKSIADAMKSFQSTNLEAFRGISSYLQTSTRSFLKEIASKNDWDGLDLAKEVNLVFAQQTNSLTDNKNELTKEDLQEFRDSIVSEFSGLIAKSRTERTKEFIRDLIATICFILALYDFHQNSTKMSNEGVLRETKKIIEESEAQLHQKIEQEFGKLNHFRVALTNVNLRNSPKKRSKILSVVKKDQIVTVLEIQHKYLLIAYLDGETGEPKTGFVVKKYFRIVK